MKKLMLLVLLVKTMACLSQDTAGLRLKAKDAKTIYITTVDLHKSKDELYATAKQWTVDYFKQPKGITLTEDKAAGTLFGKALAFVYADPKSKPYSMGMAVQIDCKANHYKIRLYDFQFLQETTPKGGRPVYRLFKPNDLVAMLNNGGKTGSMSPKAAHQLLKNFDKTVLLTMESFRKTMGTK
ncbi:MAG: DUF4468 domain-containing protein [Mucilaginibacter sp.]|nr:DUF4468 domain-containing protein [Mucilaginibacter sp.]